MSEDEKQVESASSGGACFVRTEGRREGGKEGKQLCVGECAKEMRDSKCRWVSAGVGMGQL